MEKYGRLMSSSVRIGAKFIGEAGVFGRKMHELVEENFTEQFRDDQNQVYLTENDRGYKKQEKNSKEKQDIQKKSARTAGSGFGKNDSARGGILDNVDWNRDIQVPWELPTSEKTTDYDNSGAWSKGFKTMWEVFHQTGAFRYPASQKILWFLNKSQATPLNIAEEVRNLAEMTKSFERMEKLRCNAETTALNTFLHVLCKANETGQAEALLRLVQSKLKPNRISFGIIINGWCKAGKLNRALKVFQSMRALCCVDVVAYNTLLDAMCRANKFDFAITLLKKMAEENCDPDVITYNILIHRLCKAKKLELALKVYGSMIEQNVVVPNEATYSPLIQSLCNTRNLGDAYDMLNKMKNAGFKGSIAIHTSFIKYFCRSKRIESALVVLAEMKKDGYDLNRETYHLLIGRLCLENRLEKAWELWEDMKLQGRGARSDTYSSLIQAFCCRGDLRNACRLLEEMVGNKLIPPSHMRNMFCIKCIKAGEAETVARLKNLIDNNFPEIT
eukprot:Gb_03298 [translate_table: standard]